MNEMAPAVAAADGEARLAWGPPPPHWGPPPPHWGPPPPHWGPGPILPPNVLPNLLPHILHKPQPNSSGMPGDGNEMNKLASAAAVDGEATLAWGPPPPHWGPPPPHWGPLPPHWARRRLTGARDRFFPPTFFP